MASSKLNLCNLSISNQKQIPKRKSLQLCGLNDSAVELDFGIILDMLGLVTNKDGHIPGVMKK